MVEERGGETNFGGYQDLGGQKGGEEVGKSAKPSWATMASNMTTL